ncbi:hypothetical protein, partial [Marinithermofilum abyssi]|uniref:hypothetical protein n=1 Tax=Marinithermofilum abyssi TaxID=1571185 RepID=UPI001E3B73C1
MTIKRLLAFIAGLLIEASTFIVLIGTIAFSIFHSIELLRQAGATGGLEYVGVLMFEVVFISSTATLTGTLMNKKKRNKFSNMGFAFSIAGFILGILFVWWSNISGMASSWTGGIIGFCTPVLLIISEGILAYRYLNESTKEDETQVMEIIQRNRLTVGDVLKAIEMYLANRKVDTGQMDVEKVDTEKVDTAKVDTEKVDTAKVDTEKVDTEKVDTAKVDTEKVDTAKVDTEKVDTAKVDTEKVDTAKVDTEKVDTEKVDTA